jgi:hypothetical protein
MADELRSPGLYHQDDRSLGRLGQRLEQVVERRGGWDGGGLAPQSGAGVVVWLGTGGRMLGSPREHLENAFAPDLAAFMASRGIGHMRSPEGKAVVGTVWGAMGLLMDLVEMPLELGAAAIQGCRLGCRRLLS